MWQILWFSEGTETKNNLDILDKPNLSWQGGSADWSIVSYTKRSWVCFSVRAHTSVAGLIPSRGTYGKQSIDVSLSHQCFSLSLFLFLKPINVFSGEDWKKRDKPNLIWGFASSVPSLKIMPTKFLASTSTTYILLTSFPSHWLLEEDHKASFLISL